MIGGTGETWKESIQRPPISGEMLHGFKLPDVDTLSSPILCDHMLVEIEGNVGWNELANLVFQFQRQHLIYIEHGQRDVG